MGARISDEAVKAKTGKDWRQWFAILDKVGAAKMSHKEIAQYLYDRLGVPGWWSQMVAVEYEQGRGLRKRHQKADGYAVSTSRTFEAQVSSIYKVWIDEKLRSKWLKDRIIITKATTNKSIRITWPDNTHIDVYFYSKSKTKSQVAVQHSKLGSSAQVERARSRWKVALERLSDVL